MGQIRTNPTNIHLGGLGPFAAVAKALMGAGAQPQKPMHFVRTGAGRKSILTSRCYQDRSKYTPQSPPMAAYNPPTDDRGYLVGFGTTHRARKLRQHQRRVEKAIAAAKARAEGRDGA